MLERLRAGGVRVCVDDFGIGYSSLRYLRLFPITGLKIDRSFVSGTDAGTRQRSRSCKMVLDLGRSLDLTVVAEGIETPRASRAVARSSAAGSVRATSSRGRSLDDDRDVPLDLPKDARRSAFSAARWQRRGRVPRPA